MDITTGTPSFDEPPLPSTDPYALGEQAAQHCGTLSGVPSHDVAVILGTGLADAVSSISPTSSQHDLGALPGFPRPFVSHQRSEVWSLEVGDRRVLAFLGRLHLYEGYSAVEVAHPVRTAVAAGCQIIVMANASGSLRSHLLPGDVVLIADHINLTGRSPLTGLPVRSGLPSPFVDLVDAWSPRMRALAKAAEGSLAEGVYAQVPGPHFETPAEIRMLRTMGADLVGMSTALEAIAARQMGAEVLGLSLVTNSAAGMTADSVSPDSIIGVGERRAKEVGRIIREVVMAL
jgi:purine-nucleoside phosphorylase